MSALPVGAEDGHKPGELYALGDVVALRFRRDLLALKAEPASVARAAREVQVISPGTDGEAWDFRRIATFEPAWWCLVPVVDELAAEDPEGELLVFCDETMLCRNIVLPGERSATQPIPIDDRPEPVAYYYPISAVASEIVARADSWRRRHRVSVSDWPPWM